MRKALLSQVTILSIQELGSFITSRVTLVYNFVTYIVNWMECEIHYIQKKSDSQGKVFLFYLRWGYLIYVNKVKLYLVLSITTLLLFICAEICLPSVLLSRTSVKLWIKIPGGVFNFYVWINYTWLVHKAGSKYFCDIRLVSYESDHKTWRQYTSTAEQYSIEWYESHSSDNCEHNCTSHKPINIYQFYDFYRGNIKVICQFFLNCLVIAMTLRHAQCSYGTNRPVQCIIRLSPPATGSGGGGFTCKSYSGKDCDVKQGWQHCITNSSSITYIMHHSL